MKPDARNHNPSPRYLLALIQRAGVSQRQAAALIGMSWTGFRNYLREPGDKLYRVADYRVQFALECLAADEVAGASDGRCPLCGEAATASSHIEHHDKGGSHGG